jgi:hypothetical protein
MKLYRVHLHIEVELSNHSCCCLWYSWKIAELALNNNHSFTGWCLVAPKLPRCRRGCDRMVVGFTTIYAINKVVSANPVHGDVYSIQQYVINLVSATGRWFSPGTPVSSTNKTDRHDITEILLKVAFNTITLPYPYIKYLTQRFIYVVKFSHQTFLYSWWIWRVMCS